MSGNQSNSNSTKTKSKFSNQRRTEADVRNDHLDSGALLLRFQIERSELSPESVRKWRQVERKGFKVTTEGCLISHPNHWPKGPQKISAPEASMEFFNEELKSKNTVNTTNQHGWPCGDQISHLCHRSNCCNFKHLCIEPQWKNLKRNFCGFYGSCDCGVDPPCLKTFHNSEWSYNDDFLGYGTPKLAEKLKGLLEGGGENSMITVKILEKSHFKNDDLKRENRKKRKKGQDSTREQTKKKRAKLNF